jgi:hypothetical protein
MPKSARRQSIAREKAARRAAKFAQRKAEAERVAQLARQRATLEPPTFTLDGRLEDR